jgi:hypothetical protein
VFQGFGKPVYKNSDADQKDVFFQISSNKEIHHQQRQMLNIIKKLASKYVERLSISKCNTHKLGLVSVANPSANEADQPLWQQSVDWAQLENVQV